MSDPNYEHEFKPNRKGFCKRVLKYEQCGKQKDDIMHLRWEEKHARKGESHG
jgi:hypothetical protein